MEEHVSAEFHPCDTMFWWFYFSIKQNIFSKQRKQLWSNKMQFALPFIGVIHHRDKKMENCIIFCVKNTSAAQISKTSTETLSL